MSTPKLWCSGPVHFFAGVGSGGTAVYFGTSEGSPNVDHRPTWAPLRNDLAGERPMDKSFQGEEGYISADFNRWDEGVYATMAGKGSPGRARGTHAAGDLGRLALFEGCAYQLWLQFPYSAKSAMDDMPAGYHYWACTLEGDTMPANGMRPRKIRLLWHAMKYLTPGPNNSVLAYLYNHDMTGITVAA